MDGSWIALRQHAGNGSHAQAQKGMARGFGFLKPQAADETSSVCPKSFRRAERLMGRDKPSQGIVCFDQFKVQKNHVYFPSLSLLKNRG